MDPSFHICPHFLFTSQELRLEMPEHVGGQLEARDEADEADDGEGDLVVGQESLHRVVERSSLRHGNRGRTRPVELFHLT